MGCFAIGQSDSQSPGHIVRLGRRVQEELASFMTPSSRLSPSLLQYNRRNGFVSTVRLLGLVLFGVVTSVGPVTSVFAQAIPPTTTTAHAAPAASAEGKPAKPETTAVPSPSALAGGFATGTAADVADATGNIPTKALGQDPGVLKLADGVGQNRIAINMMWTLLTGFLVMFMQAGFALVETGFCRAKNAVHVMMTNFMIYPIGMLGFWLCGFAFMFGSVGAVGNLGLGADVLNSGNAFIGTKGFLLMGEGLYQPAVYTLFLFQMIFMDTTATIPTGAMAERWKFSAFILYGFFVSMIVYPIYGHWVWGLGWLSQLGNAAGLGHGAVDFAGSGVVHTIGGGVALAGALVLGPRLGKYVEGADGKPVKPFRPRVLPAHSIPMALLGTFILAFGWFGFNSGSTLGASGGGNLRIAVIATNTMLASAGGAMGALLYWSKRSGFPDPSMLANGFLAGMVAITAPCAFTNSGWSVVIGLVAGALVCMSIEFWEKRGVDDPVGAISVHGVNGLWGVLAVGIFADGTYGKGWNSTATAYGAEHGVTGLLYGNISQLGAQALSGGIAILWSFLTAYVFFRVQHAVMGIRSRREDELAGLDMPEMGVRAYVNAEEYGMTVAHDRVVPQRAV